MFSAATNTRAPSNSNMPGDYASWPRLSNGNGSLSSPTALPQSSASMINTSHSRAPEDFRYSSPVPSSPPIQQPSRLPERNTTRPRRRKQKSCMPKIVIEQDSLCRSSRGSNRVIRIPFDDRPTLGLRGPPKQIIEIERIPCRRRKKHRSSRHKHRSSRHRHRCPSPSPPPPPPPRTTTIVTDSGLAPAQPTVILLANHASAVNQRSYLSDLTSETIQNLPRKTVVLPPIHLPGSRANAQTELETVLFPAEIINPIDGTLSIIKKDNQTSVGTVANIQPVMNVPVQPQLATLTRTASIPVIPQTQKVAVVPTAKPANSLMERFQEIFQRLNMSRRQSISPSPNSALLRPSLLNSSRFNSTSSLNSPPIINVSNTEHKPLFNTASYSLSTIGPSYPPINVTPITTRTNTVYSEENRLQPAPAINTPYAPANITPYSSTNTSFLNSTSSKPFAYAPANITPSGLPNSTSFSSTNVQSFAPSSFMPSISEKNLTYRTNDIAPLNQSGSSSYGLGNTATSSVADRPITNTSSLSSFQAEPIPYASGPTSTFVSSFTPYSNQAASSLAIDNNQVNSQATGENYNQPNTMTLKSILRNGSSGNTLENNYTSVSPSNDISSNNGMQKTTRFA